MQTEKMRHLTKAIESRLVVAINYNNEQKSHIVEPFTLGVHKDTGRVVLRCYGNLPAATEDIQSWHLFELEKIDKLELMPIKAKTERIGYQALDNEMSEIISFTLENRRF